MIQKMIDMKLLAFAGRSQRYIKKTVAAKLVTLIGNIGFAFCMAMLWSRLLAVGTNGRTAIDGLTDTAGAVDGAAMAASLLPWFIGLAASLLFRHFGIRYSQYCTSMLVGEVKCTLRHSLFSKIVGLGAGYANHIGRAELLQTAVEGVEQLETYFGGYVPQFFFCLAADVVLGAALFPFHPQAALVLFIMAPLIPLLLMMMLKKVRVVQKRYWDSYANVGSLFLDSIQGLTTLKIFGSDHEQALKIDRYAEQFRRKTMRLLSMQLNSITLINLVAYGSTAAATIITLYRLRDGQLSLFSAVLTILIAAEFFLPMRSLTSLFHVAMTGVTVADRMQVLLALPEDGRFDSCTISDGQIRVRDLDFAYTEGQPVLKGVTMTARPRQLTAIVGPSGCGKSTLSKVLTGQLSILPQQLLIDDVDVAAVSTKALYQTITLITHNAFLFEGTVRDNLLMGNESADDEMLIEVLRAVSLWDFLETQAGLDTLVASGGNNLSGGQAQRLGLARGLLHDTPIYLFDEVTSSVDVESEDVIMAVIHRLARQKTVLVISHRLESIREAEQIVVMDQGRVVENGRHDELLAGDGLYRKLYLEQQSLEAYRKGGEPV
ncbi:MAG: ABC transporter ATP-binding protein/permease [Eubacteriales bacterium]|nr:ABC transporter ATP-binding protein/permease [Eubacteriales bacterium]